MAGALTIDHVAHFVPDADAAGAALEKLGFTLTPFSPQSHRLQPGGPLTSAGTGNRCVMLDEGYIEFLTPTGKTAVATELRTAIARHIGVHLIAFGTRAAEVDHARLASEGFAPVPPVALERPISTETGQDTARFTVVRVPPGTMPEGRIQYCQHHTPELVWQPRWLDHRNGAVALAGVLVCVDEPEEAAQRFGRFTGLTPRAEANAWTLRTARGTLTFGRPEAFQRTLDLDAPRRPWIAGYALETRKLARARDHLALAGFEVKLLPRDRFAVTLPPELGGVIVFQPPGSTPLNLD
jgi:hypothetical protein